VSIVIFAKFELIMFPIAMSVFPLTTADMEMASSGREVAKLMRITPIDHSLILKEWQCLKHSPPQNAPL